MGDILAPLFYGGADSYKIRFWDPFGHLFYKIFSTFSAFGTLSERVNFVVWGRFGLGLGSVWGWFGVSLGSVWDGFGIGL